MKLLFFASLSAACAFVPMQLRADAELDATCKDIGDMAYVVMVTRQSGTMSMSHMIEGFVAEPLAYDMIIEAFTMPHLTSGVVAFRVAADFRDQWTLKCYQGEVE